MTQESRVLAVLTHDFTPYSEIHGLAKMGHEEAAQALKQLVALGVVERARVHWAGKVGRPLVVYRRTGNRI